MSSRNGVPDAWDDDWVAAADSKAITNSQLPLAPATKLTKAERRAQHQEQQRKLWEGDEIPGRKLWLEAQGVTVPLAQPLHQPVQLLSRKPPTVAKRNVADGMGNLNLEDDEDSEEERRKKQAADLEERQKKAKLEREEKQRRYAEARERIMGSSNPASTPDSRESSQGRDNRRNKGNRSNNQARRSQPETPAEQSPARLMNGGQALFDPDDMGRRLTPKREPSSTPKEDQPLRQPRGPNTSGRGGFGFAPRGGMSSA